MAKQFMVYQFNEILYSHRRRTTTGKWNKMEEESQIILSENILIQKCSYNMMPFLYNHRKVKFIYGHRMYISYLRLGVKMCVRELSTATHHVETFCIFDMSYVLIAVVVIGMYTLITTYLYVYLKYVHFNVCKLYLKKFISKWFNSVKFNSLITYILSSKPQAVVQSRCLDTYIRDIWVDLDPSTYFPLYSSFRTSIP